MKIHIYISLLLMSICQISFGQVDSAATHQLLEFDLEQLVTTPSKVKFSQQESPGIISVITDKEIAALGANDIMDVLKLVPGLSFNSDVQGVVGIGMRGIWGHEGKVLLLIDGQEMNELLYGNVAFGNHFDISQIKKIEIVRGPGSSVYGGFAELGVINIITKKAEELKTLEVNTNIGFFNNTYSHRNLSIKSGKQYKNIGFSIMGHLGQAQKSNQNYTDIYGNTTNLKNNSAANPANLNFGFNFKNFNVKLILDSYLMKSNVTYDKLDSNQLNNNFTSTNLELNYKFAFNKKLTLTPKLQYISQYPWQNKDLNTSTHANATAQKLLGNFELDYNLSRTINFLGGIETFTQVAHNFDKLKSPLFKQYNSDKLEAYTTSAYLQGTLKSEIINITIGGRYLYNNIFGNAFSPRIAITKSINSLHFKLLYSEAFKTPTLMNIGTNEKINSETTKVTEIECGYRVNTNFNITANVFSIVVKDPIVYAPENGIDKFENYSSTGSLGFEGAIKWHSSKFNIDANYSYYNTNGRNKVQNYALSQTSNSVLGLANHMANLIATYNISEHTTINSTLSYIGERYAYKFGSYNQLNDTYTPQLLQQTFQWNIFINKNNLVFENLEAGIGVTNLLNQDIYFAQPYNSLNTIYPAFNRSVNFKIGYKF